MQEYRMTRATRLQLGNVKSNHGWLQTAAGNHDKWGNLHKGHKYPMIQSVYAGTLIAFVCVTISIFLQYKDMVMYSEHICYEDIQDRCLVNCPGWMRLRSFATMSPMGPVTYRDPTPVDWLPFEIKLGSIKHASV